MPPRRKKTKMAGTRASTRLAASTMKQIAKASDRLPDADINPLASALSAGIVKQTGGNLVDGPPGREMVAQFATRSEGFLNMPLDILVEIFSLLHPRDLLSLVRTSKDFRAYLTSRRSASCWRTVRQRFQGGLPNCPPDISEPRYARLVFAEDCFNCGRHSGADSMFTSWTLLVRLCSKCSRAELVEQKRVDAFQKKVEKVTLRQDAVLPGEPCPTGGMFYLKADLRALQTKWAAAKTKQAKARVAEEYMDLVIQRCDFDCEMDAWQKAESQRIKAENDKIRRERQAQILERLKRDGWGEDLSHFHNAERTRLKALEHVNVARELTEQEWLNIRRSVTALMETLRFSVFGTAWDDQLLKRLKLAYSVMASYQAQDPREPRTAASDKQAEITDLLFAPSLRKLIHIPVNTELTADAFQPLLASLPALQEEWHQQCARELRNLVQASFGPQPTRAADGVDLLTLAVASFDCSECKRTDLRWPNVLVHRCARSRRVRLGESNQRYLDAVLALRCRPHGMPPRPWQQTFKVTERKFARECAVIRACGLDPQTTTLECMERCGMRLFCQVCSVPAVGYREAYDWKAAAKHERPRCDWLFGSYRAVKNKWQVLDAEHTATVLKLESDLQEKERHGLICVPNAFGCAHCRYHSDDASAARNHCSDAHKIVNPKIDMDYYVHLDSTHAAGEASSVGPILIYPEYSRTDRVAVKDVREGRAFFSPSLFEQ